MPDYSNLTNEELVDLLRHNGLALASLKWKRETLEKHATERGLTSMAKTNPAYSHPTKVRCTAQIASTSYPGFLNVTDTCDAIMKPERYVPNTDGRIKRFVCPRCNNRRNISGTEV